jgi:OmpA-OmpF porin, OOP family
MIKKRVLIKKNDLQSCKFFFLYYFCIKSNDKRLLTKINKSMKTLRLITAICVFSFILNSISFGQTDNKSTDKVKYNTWSATLSLGSMVFYGDLRQFDYYPCTKQNSVDWYNFTTGYSEYDRGFGIAVSKQLSPIFGIQGMIEKGGLCGFRYTKGVKAHFNASILSYGFKVKVNIIPIINPNIKKPKFSLYGITGIGLCDFRSRQWSISTPSSPQEYLIHQFGYDKDGNKVDKTSETVIPLGVGIKYKVTPKIDIGIESILNNVNTDKLDARVITGSAKDKYGFTAVTVTYNIGKADKTLEWVSPKDQEVFNLEPLFAKVNHRIDSLGQKLDALDARVTSLEKEVATIKKNVPDPNGPDDDKDGVPNDKDLEPNTAAGALVNFQGRTIPIGTTTTTTATAPLFSVYFAVNSSVIDETNQEKVATAAKMLKDNPTMKFDLVGHADKTGGAVYNDLLSKNRAQAVADLLINSFGIDKSRLIVTGKGYNEPIATDILSVNRRVDFIISK